MTARKLFSFPESGQRAVGAPRRGWGRDHGVTAIVFGQLLAADPPRVRVRRPRADRSHAQPAGVARHQVITPRLRLPAKYVPGPPKRFAQGIGATVTVAAVVAYFGFGSSGAAYVLLGADRRRRHLESVFAICLGCIVFGAPHALGRHPHRGVRAVQRHLGRQSEQCPWRDAPSRSRPSSG